MSLTISARISAIEVSWCNLKTPNDGYILLTDEEPRPPFRKHQQQTDIGQSPPTQSTHANGNSNNSTNNDNGDSEQITWTYGLGNKRALYFTQPNDANGWITTNIIFNNRLLENVGTSTKCYGYWAVYVDKSMNVIISTCIRAYPTWMNDSKDFIKRFKLRDLFLLGSHDSGSYRANFNTNKNDTLVTKYSLTQVRKQLFNQFSTWSSAKRFNWFKAVCSFCFDVVLFFFKCLSRATISPVN